MESVTIPEDSRYRPHPARDRMNKEARMVCERLGLTQHDEFVRVLASIAHREFLSEIEPLVKAKADVYALSISIITFFVDNTQINVEYVLSENQRGVIAQIDEMISAIGKRYGMTPNIRCES